MNLLLKLTIFWHATCGASLSSQLTQDNEQYVKEAAKPIADILMFTLHPGCLSIFMTDDTSVPYYDSVFKVMEDVPGGFAIFAFSKDGKRTNTTQKDTMVKLATSRKLRRISWCVTVVILSERPDFLLSFADDALDSRLFVWTTKLIIFTSLSTQELTLTISSHWLFSMMNTLCVNAVVDGSILKWKVFAYLPYSSDGPKMLGLAVWNDKRGLQVFTNHDLFPEKYMNFYGAPVNITVQHYPPYWIEEEYTKEDGTKGLKISGTDGMLMHYVEESLNLISYIVPTKDWKEVVDLVIDRVSFISPVVWEILPERLDRIDFSYVYEWSYTGFCKAKPPLTADWESLKDPLSNGVWLGILACVIITPGVLYAIGHIGSKANNSHDINIGLAILEIIGTILGQNFNNRLPKSGSGRTFMMVWLLFTFIIGSAYRGNLTAFLTLPKFPPRPETIEELVESVDVITGEAYNIDFKNFLSKSEDPAYQEFSNLMEIGITVAEGLQKALENQRSAHVDIPRYMKHIMTTLYTRPDGSTDLYIGKSSLVPGHSAWPVPHDAPFKENLDRSMQIAIEAGLYEKWNSDLYEKNLRESIKKQREHMESKSQTEESDGGDEKGDDGQQPQQQTSQSSDGGITSLTIDHMKGCLLLFVVGIVSSVLIFALEMSAGFADCQEPFISKHLMNKSS